MWEHCLALTPISGAVRAAVDHAEAAFFSISFAPTPLSSLKTVRVMLRIAIVSKRLCQLENDTVARVFRRRRTTRSGVPWMSDLEHQNLVSRFRRIRTDLC